MITTMVAWRGRDWLLVGLALLLCILAYAPGLHGSFVFDDSTFIIANTAMHVTSLRLGDWVAAALSFPSGHQGRWLGMLSFAVNHYFTGLDPFWLKLTNLAIHLVNGVLVFLLLRALFSLREHCRPESRKFDGGVAAAALSALWLVLPINLTAVLYVSQRLESLSNTFVFLGLWWYLRARLAYWRGERGPVGLWLSLVVSTGVGVLVKESAVTLPLYALCVEFALTRGRSHSGQRDRQITLLYGVLIGLPLLAGIAWLASWIGGASSYARPFNTLERLLTEARVLVDYIRWTLLPQPESLTLYHDDIPVSHGLLHPPTTLACVSGLIVLGATAIVQRARRPLFALGILWFFAGHVLTGTVIPLMLAFEHRNYFPSVGLLLACASLVALEGGMPRPRQRAALVIALLVFYGFATWMRANEWSSTLRLALSEASKRPDSSAAQYELGRVLLYAHREGQPPMTDEAFKVLERASHIPNSDILHEQLLIVGHAQLHQPVNPAWWDSLIAKLRARPPTTADIGGLMELLRCHRHGVCKDQVDKLQQAFAAAIAHPSPDGVLLSVYGDFAQHELDDPALAEKELRAALAVAPGEVTTHANLIGFLIHQGRLREARAELALLRQMNHFGALDAKINELETTLDGAENSGSPRGHPPAAGLDSDLPPQPVRP